MIFRLKNLGYNHLMLKKSFVLVLFVLLLTGCASTLKEEKSSEIEESASTQENLPILLAPSVSKEMLSADFWISHCKTPDRIIMSQKDIARWNSIALDTTLEDKADFYLLNDLRKIPSVMTAENIRRNFVYYNPSVPWYRKTEGKNGSVIHTLNEKDFKTFWVEMNIESLASYREYINQKWIPMKANKKEFPVKKAVCIRRANLRLVPEDNFYSDDKEYWYDDIAQNSGILMNEPVLVLWKSKDAKWYYVMTSYCYGWIHSEDIAFCSDSQFERYFDYAGRTSDDFVTVTAERYLLSEDYSGGKNSNSSYSSYVQETPELFMGTYLNLAFLDFEKLSEKFKGRIPYGAYIVEIPYKKHDESLGIKYAAIPYSVCTRGLVPYTQKNLLSLAFSSVGVRYGWGGMNRARDCSEYTKDIFRCFGFAFARNSRSQLSMPGKTVKFEGLSEKERRAQIEKLECGTLMGFSGHVFIYLGLHEGNLYALSALGSYYPDENFFLKKIDANSVNVNSLLVRRKTGKSWLEVLSAAKLLEDDGSFEFRTVTLDKSYEYASFSKINSGFAVMYRAKTQRKNFVVAVNAGHGTYGGTSVQTFCHPDKSPKVTGGTTAQGSTESYAVSGGMTFSDGTSEAEVNFFLATLLKEKLLKSGFDILMIRDGKDVQLDNIARTVIANNNANIHVSIHFDGDANKDDKGVFYCSIPEQIKNLKTVKTHWRKSESLGQCLVSALAKKKLKLYNEGALPVDLTQTSFSTIPTVDIELGNQHTVHSYEELEKRALALCEGITEFFTNNR